MGDLYETWKIEKPPPDCVDASPQEIEQFQERGASLGVQGREIDVFENAHGLALCSVAPRSSTF
jgi:hypothetical protein